MKPMPRFLEPGDVVEVEVENIGTLRNPITEDAAAT
jgi:2-keto-4-pentenoate hydratase/2-oxohepta-3-ene-1,7-dioic acid hydratase in catechol pathway